MRREWVLRQLIRRSNIGVVVSLGIVSALLVAYAVSEPRVRGESAASEYGYVELERAIRLHPDWQRLTRLREERDELERSWQAFVDASQVSEKEVKEQEERLRLLLCQAYSEVDECYTGQMEARRAALEDILHQFQEDQTRRIQARVAEREWELRSQLEDEVYAYAARMNQKADEYSEKVREDYRLPLLNINLKLMLVSLNDEERTRLEKEYARLEREMQAKIEAKQNATGREIEAYARKRQEEVEAELSSYRKELSQQAEAELIAEKERLEDQFIKWTDRKLKEIEEEKARQKEELERKLNYEFQEREARMRQEFLEGESKFKRELKRVSSMIEQLEGRMLEDIRVASKEFGEKHGLVVRVLEGREAERASAAGARELTELVMKGLHGG